MSLVWAPSAKADGAHVSGGLRYRAIEMNAIHPIPGETVYVPDMNNNGQCVGFYLEYCERFQSHVKIPFIWQDDNADLQADPNEVVYIPRQFDYDGSEWHWGFSPIAMNDLGHVVGTYQFMDLDDMSPALWDGEGLGYAGGLGLAGDLNNVGQIVGYSRAPSYSTRATVLTLGVGRVIFSVPCGANRHGAGERGSMIDINDRGTAVGVINCPFEIDEFCTFRYAFMWKDLNGDHGNNEGEMLYLNGLTSPTQSSFALRITEQGTVLGQYDASDEQGTQEQAFFFKDFNENYAVDDGELIPFGPIGFGPSDMNEQEAVVGSYAGNAVLWQHDELIDLNACLPADSDIYLGAADAVNNDGWILCRDARTGGAIVLVPIASNVAEADAY